MSILKIWFGATLSASKSNKENFFNITDFMSRIHSLDFKKYILAETKIDIYRVGDVKLYWDYGKIDFELLIKGYDYYSEIADSLVSIKDAIMKWLNDNQYCVYQHKYNVQVDCLINKHCDYFSDSNFIIKDVRKNVRRYIIGGFILISVIVTSYMLFCGCLINKEKMKSSYQKNIVTNQYYAELRLDGYRVVIND